MSDPTTITMNVSLPEPLKRYVDEKVASGLYGSASEFVREAIREKWAREHTASLTPDQIVQKLIEGINSGPGRDFQPGMYEAEKKRLRDKIRSRKAS